MQRNLISLNDLTKKDILSIFHKADALSINQKQQSRESHKIGGLLFFEASTRTRIGFETASWRLGIKTVIMDETKHMQTMSKAESMKDTIRTLNPYVDFFCIRHPSEGIFSEIVPFTEHPVINCGNGYAEHPTQALIDAYTIWSKFGGLDSVKITLIGESKYARSVHSLLILLSNFSRVTISEVVPANLHAPAKYRDIFTNSSNKFIACSSHIWGDEQVVYVTGFPPKNPSGTYSQTARDRYRVTSAITNKLSSGCIILDPLPRIDEIDEDVDNSPKAYYFKQNALGLYVRMAIIETFCL